MQELGECIDIIYIKHSLVKNQQDIFLKPHDKADGASAFAQILKTEDNLNIDSLPTVKLHSRPNIFKRIKLALDHLKRQSPVNYNWLNKTNKTGTSQGISYTLLTLEESAKLDLFAKSNNINSNSILLESLDKVSKEMFLKEDQKRVWMVPVNMRMPDQAKTFSGNFVTTLSVHMTDSDSPQTTYSQIRSMMKSGIIWGGWIIANTPKYIGEKRLRKLSKNIKSPYIGLCSNLGSWPPVSQETNTSQDHQWVVASPVTKYCPIATVIIKWNGRYSISCQLHPSISEDIKDTTNFIASWKKLLLQQSNQPVSKNINTLDWKYVEQQAHHF
jgi:hypothetical protein